MNQTLGQLIATYQWLDTTQSNLLQNLYANAKNKPIHWWQHQLPNEAHIKSYLHEQKQLLHTGCQLLLAYQKPLINRKITATASPHLSAITYPNQNRPKIVLIPSLINRFTIKLRGNHSRLERPTN
jgi:hypothetical protein